MCGILLQFDCPLFISTLQFTKINNTAPALKPYWTLKQLVGEAVFTDFFNGIIPPLAFFLLCEFSSLQVEQMHCQNKLAMLHHS